MFRGNNTILCSSHINTFADSRLHVVDLSLERATGEAIWAHAAQTRAVVVTTEEDFATRRQLTLDGPSVVWIRFGNPTNPDLLLRMEAQLPMSLPHSDAEKR